LSPELYTSAYATMVTLVSVAPKLVLLRTAIQTLARIMEVASWMTKGIGVTGIAIAQEGIRESIALSRLVYVIQILANMKAYV